MQTGIVIKVEAPACRTRVVAAESCAGRQEDLDKNSVQTHPRRVLGGRRSLDVEGPRVIETVLALLKVLDQNVDAWLDVVSVVHFGSVMHLVSVVRVEGR